MASVHLARLSGAAGFSRTVAIKRLHPHYAGEHEFVRMFVDEARLVSRIRHPNVVSTLDVVTFENEPFLVMDYVHGESLASLISAAKRSGERIAPGVAASMLHGALLGLHAAHEATDDHGKPLGIVHRDVSPQNVLVGTDGLARVADFGIARAASRLESTEHGQLKGKLAYMPPEQLLGRELDARSDVFAAGVVLWEALTAERLFATGETVSSIERTLNHDPAPPSRLVPGLPAALDQVVLRALQKRPEDRFASAREMAVALAQAVPQAGPIEIGDWVMRIAEASLEERSRRIREIESSSRDDTDRDAATVVGRRDAETPGAKGSDRQSEIVGRVRELASLESALNRGGRAAIVGAPGIGKSRLALEEARRAARNREVVLVSLAGADAGAMELSIANALARSEAGPQAPRRSLAEEIAAAAPLLLILDGADRVLPQVVSLVAELEGTSADVKWIVTARSRPPRWNGFVLDLGPLELAGETGPASSEAVRLFLARARVTRWDFEPEGADMASIVELVKLLDGVPLAIELAAARMTVLGPRQLLDRLRQRFAALAPAPLLQNTLDWSWDELTSEESETLRQISVFRGGFELDAAEEVVALPAASSVLLDLLHALKEKSWIFTRRAGDGALRFAMLEILRDHAEERLRAASSEAEPLGRHAKYYLETAEKLRARGDTRGAFYRRELENLRAVLDRAAEPELLVRAAVALEPILMVSGDRAPLAGVLDRVIDEAAAGLHDGLLAEALLARGRLRLQSGALDAATRDFENARTRAERGGFGRVLATATLEVARSAMMRGESGAEALMERAASLARSSETHDIEARALLLLVAEDLGEGRLGPARERLDRVLALHKASGDDIGEALALAHRAELAFAHGELEVAAADYHAALRLIGDRAPLYAALILTDLGKVHREQGDLDLAEQTLDRALEQFAAYGANPWRAYALAELGAVAIQRELPGAAREAFWEAQELAAGVGFAPEEALWCAATAVAEALRGRLEDAETLRGRVEAKLQQLERSATVTAGEMLLAVVAVIAARSNAGAATEAIGRAKELLAQVPANALRVPAVRFARETLLAALAVDRPSVLAEVSRADETLLAVGPGVRWFRAGAGDTVNLRRRQPLRLLLSALIEQHEREPAAAIGLAELLRAGWPGERVLPRAGANRVYNALATLRTLGLRELLERVDEGYRLHPAVRIERQNDQ